jgi:1,4-dihydroxy-2-naphthoate octaprenyltransferase
MRGYTLLTRNGYALVYMLTALALGVSTVGTLLGLWAFGDVIWWPALLFLVLVVGLEIHSYFERN